MSNVRDYALVTGAYWSFTLTDGALRMLVLLHFHALGFSPVQVAFLFLLYEFFGIVTNLLGGWIGSRTGLKVTLYAGLALQIVALTVLSLLDSDWPVPVAVGYVMGAQALSGIAKDLTKMSAKSSVKLLAPEGSGSALFRLVAILTGSKNALKGVGFFLGGALLAALGFQRALWLMAAGLVVALLASVALIRRDLGRTKAKVKFRDVFSTSREVNLLSAARVFLFASRDVWFVVALPIFLYDVLGWTFSAVGAFMAAWVIGYGVVQSATPSLLAGRGSTAAGRFWGMGLAAIPAAIAAALYIDAYATAAVLGGLMLFGVAFAVNSSLHSYLILAFSRAEGVSLDVGFYYMANAVGRLAGTLLSGVLYLAWGLPGCLWTSAAMLAAAVGFVFLLPAPESQRPPSLE